VVSTKCYSLEGRRKVHNTHTDKCFRAQVKTFPTYWSVWNLVALEAVVAFLQDAVVVAVFLQGAVAVVVFLQGAVAVAFLQGTVTFVLLQAALAVVLPRGVVSVVAFLGAAGGEPERGGGAAPAQHLQPAQRGGYQAETRSRVATSQTAFPLIFRKAAIIAPARIGGGAVRKNVETGLKRTITSSNGLNFRVCKNNSVPKVFTFCTS
jgi:hypothetical protein